ncbi:hypothetical protein DOY81_009393 [Sarcophaga bullata]|nr:hypothetical protein DOY81_009393 [Sarcophaga bullata]
MDTLSLTPDSIASRSRTEVIAQEDILDTSVAAYTRKPTVFGESSSEDDEECEHCFGHPEKRRRNRKPTDDQPEHNEHSHSHSHKDEETQTNGND